MASPAPDEQHDLVRSLVGGRSCTLEEGAMLELENLAKNSKTDANSLRMR